MRDVRDAGLCVRGARVWFTKHGLDFKNFVVNGIVVEEVQAVSRNDAFAVRVIEQARKRTENKD